MYICILCSYIIVRNEAEEENLTQGDVSIEEEEVLVPTEPDTSGKKIRIEVVTITPISVQIAVHIPEEVTVWCNAETSLDKINLESAMRQKGELVISRFRFPR